MEEKYDVIVLGTGLTECILSGLFSREGKKVLHMDRNDYYGGDSASLNVTNLYRKFKPELTPPKALVDFDREYCVDTIPKLMLATGTFVKMLVCCDVAKYLEFKHIDGSYVYRDGKIYKVPFNEKEALFSSLLGLLEKNRARCFFGWISSYKQEDPKTWKDCDISRCTMAEVFTKFSIDEKMRDFIGHALALHLDDSYLSRPAVETIDRVILYKNSIQRFGKSPYVYPVYGLGELPQAFARCSAVYGGTYMLNTPIDNVFFEEVDDGNGEKKKRVGGIESQGQRAYAPLVIASPSYFKDRCRSTGRVVRSICLISRPIDGLGSDASIQLIMPQSQLNRKNDIYVIMLSSAHNVCPKNVFIAIASTKIETANPEGELDPAHLLYSKYIIDKFVDIVDIYEPTTSGTDDGVVLSRSYDATSHFETVSDDVFELYKRATGNDLALKEPERRPEDEE